MALLQMLFVGLIASRRGYPRERRPTLQQVGRHLVGALPAMCAPVILIGGMTLGIFSATEAAVVAVVYSVALSFAYRELSLRELLPMSMEVGREVAVLTIIIATAMIFGWILTVERVPQAMADVVLAWATYPGLLLLAIVALIVFLGCFMEGTVLLLLLPPIFVPALVKAGIDPVHFGIVMIIAVGIGLYTPPVGVALYAMQSFTGMSFRDVSQAAIPWLVPMIGALLIVMYWPAAVLVVPRAFGY
jgi:tripartite ATP-independent transporter DctM subunit